jgi:hypothetical protein
MFPALRRASHQLSSMPMIMLLREALISEMAPMPSTVVDSCGPETKMTTNQWSSWLLQNHVARLHRGYVVGSAG